MEESETPHPDYMKGFNEGYLLNKYMPELGQKLSEVVQNSLRGNGFKDGRSQERADQDIQKTPAWLKEDRIFSSMKSTDISKDKGRE